MRYIFGAGPNLTEQEVQQVVKQIENTYLEESDVIMTLAEMYRKEGRQEGKQEGIQESRKEIAVNMLKDGLSVEEVVKYANLSRGTVEDLKEKLR